MEKKQTAVQWLIKEISRDNIGKAIIATLDTEFKQALQMERERIEEAYKQGQYDSPPIRETDAAQYYTQTFKP